MLGKRGPQRGLFEADTAYGAFVGRDSFYGWLASQRGELFRDEEFAGLYVLDNGRPSVPPSLLATALVLQTYDGVSDDEAKQRADYDLRWKVALGVELDARPFAKSTLQEFRAQLIVHEEQAAIFQAEPGAGEAAGEVSDQERGAAEAEGGAGHDEHPGAGGGEGHLQPAGGRDREAGAGAGEAGGAAAGGVGRGAGVRAVRGADEPEGDGRDRLGRRRSSGGGSWGRSSPTPTGCWSRRGRRGAGWRPGARPRRRWWRRPGC